MSQKNKTNTKPSNTKPKTKPAAEPAKKNDSYFGEIVTCILALPTIFILISLTSYYSGFFSGSGNIQENFFTGTLGYDCAHAFDNLFGIVSFYIPLAVIAMVIVFFLKKQLWKYSLLNFANFVMLLPFSSMIIAS